MGAGTPTTPTTAQLSAPSFKSSGKNGSEIDVVEQEPTQPHNNGNASSNTTTTEVACS